MTDRTTLIDFLEKYLGQNCDVFMDRTDGDGEVVPHVFIIDESDFNVAELADSILALGQSSP